MNKKKGVFIVLTLLAGYLAARMLKKWRESALLALLVLGSLLATPQTVMADQSNGGCSDRARAAFEAVREIITYASGPHALWNVLPHGEGLAISVLTSMDREVALMNLTKSNTIAEVHTSLEKAGFTQRSANQHGTVWTRDAPWESHPCHPPGGGGGLAVGGNLGLLAAAILIIFFGFRRPSGKLQAQPA